jgi:hypothetical protein
VTPSLDKRLTPDNRFAMTDMSDPHSFAPRHPDAAIASDGAVRVRFDARFGLATGAIVLVAAVLRVAAGCDRLWLDEIWSVQLIRHVAWPIDILTSLHHENNHYLNTFWIWLLGPEARGQLYRLPAMLAGTAAVAIAGLIAPPRGHAAVLFALILSATSYVQVHYSSEARGYALAVCFALLSLHCTQTWLARRRVGGARCTAFAAIAGVLSQPVFLVWYGALLVWSAWKVATAIEGKRRLWRQWFWSHLAVLLFTGWLYLVDIREMVNGGGPIYPLFNIVVETLALAVGGIEFGPQATWIAAMVVLLYLGALIVLWKEDRDFALLSVLAVWIMPVAVVVLTGRREIYPRYFVIPIALLHLTFAFALAGIWKGFPRARWAAVAALAVCLAGNGLHIARLIRLGRDNGETMLRDLARGTGGKRTSLGSDQDFRASMVLGYFAPRVPEAGQLVYYNEQEWPPLGPEWLLFQSLDRTYVPEEELVVRRRRYRLARFYPHAGLSGWSWATYHNEAYTKEDDSGPN